MTVWTANHVVEVTRPSRKHKCITRVYHTVTRSGQAAFFRVPNVSGRYPHPPTRNAPRRPSALLPLPCNACSPVYSSDSHTQPFACAPPAHWCNVCSPNDIHFPTHTRLSVPYLPFDVTHCSPSGSHSGDRVLASPAPSVDAVSAPVSEASPPSVPAAPTPLISEVSVPSMPAASSNSVSGNYVIRA